MRPVRRSRRCEYRSGSAMVDTVPPYTCAGSIPQTAGAAAPARTGPPSSGLRGWPRTPPRRPDHGRRRRDRPPRRSHSRPARRPGPARPAAAPAASAGRPPWLPACRRPAPPAGMGRAHLAAIGGGKHHRQAVGGQDRQHHARHRGYRRVGHRLARAGHRRCIEAQHGAAVHLAQPVRRRRQCQPLLQQLAVVLHVGRVSPSAACRLPRLNCANGAGEMPAPCRRVVSAWTPAGAGQSACSNGSAAAITSGPARGRRRLRCLRAAPSSGAACPLAPARYCAPAHR